MSKSSRTVRKVLKKVTRYILSDIKYLYKVTLIKTLGLTWGETNRPVEQITEPETDPRTQKSCCGISQRWAHYKSVTKGQ